MKTIIVRYLTIAGLLGTVAWLVSSPSWEPAVAVTGLLATFITIDNLHSPKHYLEGRWEYEVTTASKEFSHKGDCYIRQTGDTVQLQGVRQYTCSLKARRKICQPVNIPWKSDWAQVCDDNILRFHYHIAIAEPRRGGKHIEAICRLELTSQKPTEMTGNYYMLPPFDEATLNCKWGAIVFRRIEETAQLLPPNNYESENESLEEITA